MASVEEEKKDAPDSQGEDRPEVYYVISDSAGFVGAFYSLADAKDAVLHKYPLVPFMLQRFPVAPGPVNTVWVVLNKGNDSVAFVTNDRDEAVRVQKLYESIGLTYPDNINYWEYPANHVSKYAVDRLTSIGRAHQMYADTAIEKEVREREAAELSRLEEALWAAKSDGPLARILRETEPITIFDCVIPLAARDFLASAAAPVAELPAAEPAAAEPTAAEPTAAEPTATEPTAAEPTAAEPIAAEPTAAEPTAAEPIAAEPTAAESTAAESTAAV